MRSRKGFLMTVESQSQFQRYCIPYVVFTIPAKGFLPVHWKGMTYCVLRL